MTRVRQRQQKDSLREVQGGTSIGTAPGRLSTVVVRGVSGGVRAVVRMGCLGQKPLPVLLAVMTATS